jgi:hypothetical protein
MAAIRKSKAVNKQARSQRTNVVSGLVSVYPETAKNAIIKPIAWGNDDKLPHKILEAVMDSGTATACWEKLDFYIQADGFINEIAADFKVNPKQTSEDLLNEISPDFALWRGFALRVKYNLAFQVAEVYHVPLQYVRKLEDGRFVVNHTRGTRFFKRQNDEILQPFNNDPAVVEAMFEEIKANAKPDKDGVVKYVQNGQLLFVYRKTARSSDYPLPSFWTLAGAKDIYSDTEIAITDLDNLENNFTPPVIVHFEGNVDTTKVNDETGLTEFDQLVEDVSAITDKENRSQAVVLTGNYKPNLIAWDNTKALLSLDQKRDTIGRAVCRHFGVPAILCNFLTAGALSQSREILNSIQLFQNDINVMQNQIARTFQLLFPQAEKDFWYLSIKNPLDVIPTELLQYMNDAQKQAIIERFS